MHDLSPMQDLSEALRQNIIDITENLSMRDGHALDLLFSKGCLSKNDCDRINARDTEQNQIRMLIVLIKDSSPEKIELFLDFLKSDPGYEHLYTKIIKSKTTIANSSKTPICLICFMKERVDLIDIADHLWKDKVISGTLYSDIVAHSTKCGMRQVFWPMVFECLNKYDDKENTVIVLEKALSGKHSHILQWLKDLPKHKPFQCCCIRRRKKKPRKDVLRDTESEISTTSSKDEQNVHSLKSTTK